MAAGKAVVLQFVGDTKSLEAAFSRVSGQTKSLDSNLSKFGSRASKIGESLTKAVTLPLIGIGTASVKMATDFNDSMEKIVSLVGVSQKQVGAWSQSILSLSGKVAVPPKELADALFFVASAGFRGKAAIDVLTASAKASATGLGDVKTIADVVTSAVNVYGQANLSASRSTDVLTATVRTGKMDAAALGAVLGQVIQPAKVVGVSFDQVGAAMSAMSIQGLDAAQGATALRALFTGIIKPAASSQKAFKDIGLSVDGFRKEVASKGLLPSLMDLKKRIGDNKDALGKLFPNVRALNAFLALTGGNAKQTASIFKQLKDSTGATDEAFKKTSETSGFKFKQALVDLKVAGIQLGNVLIPFVTKAAVALSGLFQRFSQLSPGTKQFLAEIGAAAAIIGPVVLIMGKLARAISNIASVVSSAIGGVKSIIGWISKIGAASEATAAETEAAAAAQKASWLSTSAAAVKNAAIQAGAWLAANPPAAIAIGIAAVGAGAVLLALHMLSAKSAMDRFRDSMNEAASAASALSGKLQTLKGTSLDLREAIQNHTDALNHLKDVQTQVSNGTLKGAEAQSQLTHAQIDVARTALDVTTAQKANAAAAKDAAKSANDNVTAIQAEITAARNRVTEIKNSISPLDHSTQSSQRLANAQHDLAVLLEKVGGKAHDTASAIRDSASDAGKAAPNFQTLASKVQSGANSLNNLATKLQNVSAVAPQASSDASTIGSSIVQGVVSGINTKAPLINSAIQTILQGGVAAGKATLGIRSPSKVLADEVGTPIGQGIAQGILGAANLIDKAMSFVVKNAIAKNKMSPNDIAVKLGLLDPDHAGKINSDSQGQLDYAYAQLTPQINDDLAALQKIVGEDTAALLAARKNGSAQDQIDAANALKSATDNLAALGPIQQLADGTLAPLSQSTDNLTAPAGTAPGAGFTVLSDSGQQAWDAYNASMAAVQTTYQAYLDALNPPAEIDPVQAAKDAYVQAYTSFYGSAPAMAAGGIVNRPTMALIGEAGPEAVVPLSQWGGGGGGNTYNLTVNSPSLDPNALATTVIQAINQYERRNGQRYVRV